MSNTAARYQNALTYNPSRSVGTYLDGRAQGADYDFEPVASRTPRMYDPYISGPVAQWAPLNFGTTTSGGVADMSAGPDGANLLGLMARYGPSVFKAIDKAQGLFGDSPDGFDTFENNAWNDPGFYQDGFVGEEGPVADYFAYVGDDGHDLAAGFVDAASYGGADAAAVGGAEAAAGGAVEGAAGGAGGYGDLMAGGANALGGAAGGWAGNYIGQSINDGRIDSTENGQIGAAVGGVIGSFIPIPVAGTLFGAYAGGLIGSQIGRETDMPSVYAQGFYNPDGSFSGSGVMRHGGGSYDTANALSQIAPNYFEQRAAQDGLAPNTGMNGQGYFFGGGSHDGVGGWFLQPNERGAGEVRPDLWGLYAGANADIGYGEGGEAYIDPAYQAAARAQGVTGIDVHRPTNFNEALDAAYTRLQGWGYFVDPSTNLSPADAQAAYAAHLQGYNAPGWDVDGGVAWGTNHGANPADSYNVDQGAGG
ncbi:MAG: hypothetical protein JWO24_786 [Rhodospirillales bacterium]|nr:hypothetical protein [Rhodospirillales bacterium]